MPAERDARVTAGTDEVAGWTIAGLGLVLVGAAVVNWRTADVDTFDAFIVTLPGVATAATWLYLRRSGLGSELYPAVLRAAVVGGVTLGGFVLVVALVQGGDLATTVPLLVFMTGVGCTAGALVGTNRAQSRRAREQAAAVREERERLRFLNHLLRHNVLNKANVIQGEASLAAAETDADDPHLDTIRGQTDDMVELIENIRVLVRAASGDTARRPIDLTAELRTEVASMEGAHEAARIEADVPDDLTVLADDLVRYVFENLLHNAIVHNDSDRPHVAVTARAEGDEVVVTVVDDGPGIPDADKEGVFEPGMDTGYGVGLHLVRTLVTEYGGSVEVGDADPRGAVVTVRLPAA